MKPAAKKGKPGRPRTNKPATSTAAQRKPGRPAKAKPAPLTKKTAVALEAHDLANLLPEMTADQFAAFKESIHTGGQRDPIILFEGKILDGRHRYRACVELGLTPITRDFDPAKEGPAAKFVYDREQHRSMTESQKACAAARIEPLLAKAAHERQVATLKQNQTIPPTIPPHVEAALVAKVKALKPGDTIHVYGGDYQVNAAKDLPDRKTRDLQLRKTGQFKDSVWVSEGVLVSELRRTAAVLHRGGTNATTDAGSAGGKARDQAGELFGVSPRYVQVAKLLLRESPALFQEAFKGEVPLTVALRKHRSATRTAHVQAKARALPPVSVEQCTLIVGDNLDELPNLPRKAFRLIFEDGPYNIGVDYGDGEQHDKLTPQQFLANAEARFEEYPSLLTPDGAVWCLINDEYAAEYCVTLKSAGLHLRAWVKWYETFGNNCTNNFNRTSRHLLYFTRSKSDFVFHPEAFNCRSWRQDNGDPRANPAGKIWDDVWTGIPRLVENARERLPQFPTQLPLALVRPIVEGCTDPGDSVLDPFNGSGTTGDACLRTGRKFTGIELRKPNAPLAQARWAATAEELRATAPAAKGGKAS